MTITNDPFDDTMSQQTDFLAIGRKLVLAQMEVLGSLTKVLDSEFERAVSLIQACNGMVVVTGLGKSGHIGRKLASTLSSLGTSAFFMHGTEACHGDCGAVQQDSVLIALSHSGRTQEILEAVSIVRDLGVPVIAITNRRDSPLAKLCDVVIAYEITSESDHLNLAPTSSTTAMLVLGDALAVTTSVALGFTRSDFFKCHSAGNLGSIKELD